MLSAETEFRIGKPYRRTTTLYVYFHKGFRGGNEREDSREEEFQKRTNTNGERHQT